MRGKYKIKIELHKLNNSYPTDCASFNLNVILKRACAASRRAAARCGGAAGCWALRARLLRLQPELERALAPAPTKPYADILASCQREVIANCFCHPVGVGFVLSLTFCSPQCFSGLFHGK